MGDFGTRAIKAFTANNFKKKKHGEGSSSGATNNTAIIPPFVPLTVVPSSPLP